MMGFLKRMLTAGSEVQPHDLERIRETERRIDEERGEYRQTVARTSSGTRLMLVWENANRMVRGQE